MYYACAVARWGALVMLSAALSGAPFQCSSEPDPSRAIEETPGQALYELAVEFKKNGDERAWRETLQYLIARYPSSRFAGTARRDLEAVTPEPPPPDPSRTAASPP